MTLKLVRMTAGLTIAELSRRSGIHTVTLCRLESGAIKIENMSLKNAVRLARALSISAEELLTLT